jgi:hypothetical protein
MKDWRWSFFRYSVRPMDSLWTLWAIWDGNKNCHVSSPMSLTDALLKAIGMNEAR